MGCCGQGRAALRATTGTARGTPGVSRAAPAALVRYVGGKRVRVRGSASGQMYEFTGGVRTAVDGGDAAALLRTGLFVRD
jgi:hypothetical protein